MVQVVRMGDSLQVQMPPDVSPYTKACICSDAIRALSMEQARNLMAMDDQPRGPQIQVAPPGMVLPRLR